jgi:hypothetical protein
VAPLALAATAPPALSAEPAGEQRPLDAPLEAAPKLRNGIAIGMAFGVGLGRGSGYPNNSQEIGDSHYYADSGVRPGTGNTILVLGALTDYLNFGFLLSSSTFQGGGVRASDFGLGVRVEAFPLVSIVPRLQGLAAFAEFGLGSGILKPTAGPTEAQGTQSFIGVGTFYEWSFGHFLGGHFAAGPCLEYDAMFSRPYNEGGVLASGRIVFYGGP